MNEFNNNNPNNQGAPPASGQVPPPPPPPGGSSVDIRTMNSDLNSIKQNGGSSPTPSSFNIPASEKPDNSSPTADYSSPGPIPNPSPSPADSNSYSSAPAAKTTPNSDNPASGPASFDAVSSAPNITDNEPVFNPNGDVTAAETGSRSLSAKRISIITISVIAAIFLGYLAYIYGYPLLFVNDNNITDPDIAALSNMDNSPSSPQDSSNHESNLDNMESSIESDMNFIHTPYIDFENSTSTGNNTLIVSLGPTFKSNLTALVADDAQNSIQEMLITNLSDEPASFAEVMSFLTSSTLSQSMLEDHFSSDFTAFIYYDSSGEAWPGYIGKLKSSSDLFIAQSDMQDIEDTPSFGSFFIVDQGARISEFKDGQIDSLPARYLTFSNPKAFIDYLWIDNYFIISTSYDDLKTILPKLVF